MTLEKEVVSRNPLKTGLSTASLGLSVVGELLVRNRRNPLKTGLSTARVILPGWVRVILENRSQSPENGSQHCKWERNRTR